MNQLETPDIQPRLYDNEVTVILKASSTDAISSM